MKKKWGNILSIYIIIKLGYEFLEEQTTYVDLLLPYKMKYAALLNAGN